MNGEIAVKKKLVLAGDIVAVFTAPELEITTLVPEDIHFPIVFEDDHLVVVNKPKGMVTHPGNGVHTGTLANALAFKYPNLSDVNGPMRPGILHRLDKDTSGLLVVAKNNAAHLNLAKQLEARDIHRVYHALVWREMADASGSVDQPIARNPRDHLKMGVQSKGKRALTHYKVLGFYNFASHLELTLDTGRTHQIRVHMNYLNHPVIGDPTYGGRQTSLTRIQPIYQPYAIKLLSFFQTQALHAHKLSFFHPVTGTRMDFESPLPSEMVEGIQFLQKFKHE